eukprot:10577648-Ditylum_brightwellii.AAC.1
MAIDGGSDPSNGHFSTGTFHDYRAASFVVELVGPSVCIGAEIMEGKWCILFGSPNLEGCRVSALACQGGIVWLYIDK